MVTITNCRPHLGCIDTDAQTILGFKAPEWKFTRGSKCPVFESSGLGGVEATSDIVRSGQEACKLLPESLSPTPNTQIPKQLLRTPQPYAQNHTTESWTQSEEIV